MPSVDVEIRQKSYYYGVLNSADYQLPTTGEGSYLVAISRWRLFAETWQFIIHSVFVMLISSIWDFWSMYQLTEKQPGEVNPICINGVLTGVYFQCKQVLFVFLCMCNKKIALLYFSKGLDLNFILCTNSFIWVKNKAVVLKFFAIVAYGKH